MTTSRAGCAARRIYRDKHQCVTSWWTVTSPEGQTYELCSGICLVSFAVLGALPKDVQNHVETSAQEAA